MKKLDKKHIKVRMILFIICFVVSVLIFIDNRIISVSFYDYSNEVVTNDGFTIVQLSDIHNANFGIGNNRLLKKIKSLEPDIIVITGDLVDSNHGDVERSIRFAENLTEIADTYFVMGNHEYWKYDVFWNSLTNSLDEAGVNVMFNDTSIIEANGYEFALIGLDDRNLSDTTLSDLVANSGEDLNVVLAHEPQYFDKYAKSGADLIFTGHVHGGQFRIPFVGGLLSPEFVFFPKYSAGLYTAEDIQMIVSRGIGNSVIRFRIFNRPEIVCVTLKSQTANTTKL